MLIFVDTITDRLIYTLDFIFKNRGISYEITNDWIHFQNSKQTKFIYSEKYDEKILSIKPATILFDEAIFNYILNKNTFYKKECLSFNKIIDPFASIFYILSRMEEYTIKQRDIHDRFQAKNSILYQFSWLNYAICDHWAEDIIAFLENRFNLKLNKIPVKMEIIPTFDIDNTFAFQWKEGFRRIMSIIKDYLKRDYNRIRLRKRVESKQITDPYDTFEYIKSLKEFHPKIKIFWLLGDYSKFDKNISGNDIRHQKLINEMSSFYDIGLHPSYESNKNTLSIKNEKKLLETILKKNVTNTRQHFLKLNLPSTYSNLIQEGFINDYSMGFAEETGFRAGTARPYRYFDLTKNNSTNFWIHPFLYMDQALNHYLKLTPKEAKIKIKFLFDEVKKYGGNFIFIWHNETIHDDGIWKGWKDVFEYTLNLKNEI